MVVFYFLALFVSNKYASTSRLGRICLKLGFCFSVAEYYPVCTSLNIHSITCIFTSVSCTITVYCVACYYLVILLEQVTIIKCIKYLINQDLVKMCFSFNSQLCRNLCIIVSSMNTDDFTQSISCCLNKLQHSRQTDECKLKVNEMFIWLELMGDKDSLPWKKKRY